VEWVTRKWPTSNLGTTLINPNRTWRGEESGNTVERQCWLITNRLIKGNVDVGVDYHTGGTGSDFALFVFAYAKDAESLRMPELFPVDQIMAADSGGSRPRIRDDVAHHCDLISLGVPR
jgi:predicted deacylase